MEKKELGVRKGAWTKEEDTLLRNCINKFGEGKWHKVPPRAGLNRCRKSCRLRWLNYLRPNIKRGYFTKDEIDLIQRLHKLIGNRWSLIAGRLPGRTANDVKNFWNTHILKKTSSLPAKINEKTEKNILVKPRPRTFSKSHVPVRSSEEDNKTKDEHDKPSSSASFLLSEEEVDECIRWWLDGDERTPVSFSDKDDAITQPVFSPEEINEKIAELSSIATDGHDIWDFTNLI